MKKILLTAIVLMTLFLTGTGCVYKREELSYSGRVEATEVDVSSEVGGIVKEFAVSQGDSVKKGQLLVELDDKTAILKLSEAKAAQEAVEARLKEALSGTRSEKIAAARAAVKNVQANLEQAKSELEFYIQKEERYRKLLENDALDEQSYDNVALALKEAQKRVAALEAQLAQARFQLELLEAGNTANYIDMLRAELKSARAVKEQAELELQKFTVESPLDGIVSLKNFEEGELVRSGSNLLTIINLQEQWVNIYVPQSELGKWKLGDKVSIVADAFPREKFSGEIVYIASEAEFTPKNVQTKETRMDTVFKVKVKILQGKEKLRPGMWVEVFRGDI